MNQLTSALLGRACRTFLTRAYPAGEASIPTSRRVYLHLDADQPLETVLKPPVWQGVVGESGEVEAYAFRLGSATYPHLKLKVSRCEGDAGLVFSVDTHDGMLNLDPGHPDAPQWRAIQQANRQLKEEIEKAWEDEGILTFNAMLRRQLKESGDWVL